ncbi:hypothetical protein F4553_000560 [Allocatelliglobosispora scoriae]|uniref:Fatty acid desaturase domain-containing protein n=1 Tax=Allocatelliglobosispora scoriae TaxID=643052 RepID=A0A841BJV8_9ACTN|nr:fatty acid desaturase [Allocatelliglobosispora scoriae]MBB5867181.1 hypothetical protein [Allocatelliglobosispora scoriae]
MTVLASRTQPARADRPAASEIRDSMTVLPRWCQLPLTLLTGKPYTGQAAPQLTATFHLAAAVASVVVGVAIAAAGWLTAGWALLLLPAGWAATLHGARNLRMLIFHQCSHRNMYGRRSLDNAIGYAIPSLLIIQNFQRYSREHVSDHHAVHHMTLRDPTVQAFLVSLGLRPGTTRRQMWTTVLRKLVSPWFHLQFLVARIRSFATGSAPAEKAAAIGIYGTAAVLATAADAWALLAVVWFVPLVPLYQISNTLRLCVKHTFPTADTTHRRGREHFAGLTNAIFLGSPAPAPGASPLRAALAWLGWSARMLLWHLPVRYLVLTGDTVVHDFHHRYPVSRRWVDYIFARQHDLDAGHPGWPPYTEEWGLIAAINRVFDSLAAADPDEFDIRRIASVSRRELFAAFDD